MLTAEKAHQIAREWLKSWNSHELSRIVEHYSDSIEFISPFAVKLLNDPAGVVKGKAALKDYFAKGLAVYPNLKFNLHGVLVGVRRFTIYYESVNNLMAAETMDLDEKGLIVRVLAHYAPK